MCSAVAGEPFIPLFKGRIAPGAAAALAETLSSGQLATGPKVKAFEDKLGQFVGNPHCVATSDRAGALTIALRLCGVTPGDDVMLSPLACLATTMPIANLGAKPVWCDVDPDTGMLNPALLAARRTARTKAIIHYHWGGDVGPLGELQQVAVQLGIPLIADASGAFGAELQGQKLGATGSDFTIYSFYAVSHLPAGDGGALFCRSAEHAERARQLRRFGIDHKTFRLPNGDLNPQSDIPIAGYSMAMTDLTAALALEQFNEVEHTLARHRANGRELAISTQHLSGITPLSRGDEQRSAYWVFAFRAAHRERLIARLQAAGIGAQRLHVRNDRYSCFRRSSADELPGVEIFDRENLCVPCGWWVDEAALARILECLQQTD